MSSVPVPEASQAPVGAGLSQIQRVIYTFTAPSKTFSDIKRSTSWWLPFVLSAIVTFAFFGAIQAKVGWNQVVENNIRNSPKQAEAMEKLQPEQRASQMKIIAITTEATMAAAPILSLIVVAIMAGVLLATINFGFGGKAKFWEVFVVCWFAGLPNLFKFIVGIIALFAGLAPESFNINNPAGTNVGWYLPQDTAKPIMAIASSLDLITIWTLVLTGIGLSIVAGTKRTSGYIAVFGWWILIVLVGVGAAAAFS